VRRDPDWIRERKLLVELSTDGMSLVIVLTVDT
jgi:hypothetical protein